jgi:RimJ/RimL family protein N-acetyltransferase
LTAIVQAYSDLKHAKEDPTVFAWRLLHDTTSWFKFAETETGEQIGVLYLSNIIEGLNGDLKVVFWDGKLRADRKTAVRHFVEEMFRTLHLQRMTVHLHASNVPLKRLLRQLGFVYEGTMRRAWLDSNGLSDILIFGLLREEYETNGKHSGN